MEVAVLIFIRFKLTTVLLCFFLVLTAGRADAMKKGEFLVLCYHAVLATPALDDVMSVSQKLFAEHMEYIKTHGFTPVSLDDIIMAAEGKKDLPDKPILLTFDDAYISYYDFVLPFLEEMEYPSILAVVGDFIDHYPEGMPEPLMSWDQIKEVSSHELVEVVSHTYGLHKAIQYNPQGNVGSAISVTSFNWESKKYESTNGFRERLEQDFIKEENVFKSNLGFMPKAIVWPYGRYNSISMDIARSYGIKVMFTLEEGIARIDRLEEINRNLIENKSIDNFIRMLKDPDWDKPLVRAMQVDLDLIYDDSLDQMDRNLGRLIDRLVEMKVNTVYLQAFADPDGTGNIESVYFQNSILPVRADFFSHAVHQMIIRDIFVYAWMPVLSMELPDRELNERLKVRSLVNGEPVASRSWYRRLTPFSDEVKGTVKTLYEELAARSQIHGVLFQDDAYLTDKEDFHPLALKNYKDTFGTDMRPENIHQDSQLSQKWTRYKTETIINFTRELMESVRTFRPNALFGRNLYSRVIIEPECRKAIVMAASACCRIKKIQEWNQKDSV